MARQLRVVWWTVGCVAAVLGGAMLGRTLDRDAASVEHQAFRCLPWSRLAEACDADGRWSIRLGPLPRDCRAWVLGSSCGCAHASLDPYAGGHRLSVRVDPQRRPERVSLRIGVETRGGARAARTVTLVPRYGPPPRACLPVPVLDTGAARGLAVAHTRLPSSAPPHLAGVAGLGAVAWPAGPGHHVLVQGFIATRGGSAGRLHAGGVEIPLRTFRRIR